MIMPQFGRLSSVLAGKSVNFTSLLTPDASRLFEIARLPVRLNHVARRILNANHGIVWKRE
jgi:hypothetical protein